MSYFFLLLTATRAIAQSETDSLRQLNDRLDSLFIDEVEDRRTPDKVLHAEPLYIDLIRDLGARKGEREWNVGMGLTDNLYYDTYDMLIEYEWAPVNRLGLEVEIPITLYGINGRDSGQNGLAIPPANRIESLKLAAQWSFLVSERAKTTLALGYINSIKLADIQDLSRVSTVTGNQFNPFLIAAKRWGNRFHTLVYTGPVLTYAFQSKHWKSRFEMNSSVHYMIPGTRNFVGLEVNQSVAGRQSSVVMRPQLRVGVTSNLLLGIVTGIPLSRQEQRLSSFLRLIYEPAHKNRKPVQNG
ncbi:phosphoribosylformylglycinamidine synthase [Spirosoma montaniterrae]|uniref:Phosphoribosylformylglycinamidine synthase n=2 Tax=Spirosoma montaniterrae TaxID=1178516 RepID=A0A1P9X4F0_9BACT|nr:phosphoribosylformylglycinamidine synthase [Spirosoma montaniterrae]